MMLYCGRMPAQHSNDFRCPSAAATAAVEHTHNPEEPLLQTAAGERRQYYY